MLHPLRSTIWVTTVLHAKAHVHFTIFGSTTVLDPRKRQSDKTYRRNKKSRKIKIIKKIAWTTKIADIVLEHEVPTKDNKVTIIILRKT